MTLNVLAWIVVGLIAGMLARIAMPGPDPGGILTSTVIGIVGALTGGFIIHELLGRPGLTGVNLPTILVATLGSIILLSVYRLVTRRTT